MYIYYQYGFILYPVSTYFIYYIKSINVHPIAIINDTQHCDADEYTKLLNFVNHFLFEKKYK